MQPQIAAFLFISHTQLPHFRNQYVNSSYIEQTPSKARNGLLKNAHKKQIHIQEHRLKKKKSKKPTIIPITSDE